MTRTLDYSNYETWRSESLSRSWAAFPDAAVTGKDVLDFGCGDGPLAIQLATTRLPRRIVGVDISEPSIVRARANLANTILPDGVRVEFVCGSQDGLPFEERSFDTLLAFDCMEHVMSPGAILSDWHRVLRPGGRCLIEWFPFKGPWGPHMEALIPIPWAHVLFGQEAMFRTAAMIYDLPEFVPRHWDLDELGQKKPNKWRSWSTFKEQGYVNELNVTTFLTLARKAGFRVSRFEQHSFGGSGMAQTPRSRSDVTAGSGRILRHVCCSRVTAAGVIDGLRPSLTWT